MATDIQDLLEAAAALPPQQQIELLQALAQRLTPIAPASLSFWSSRPLIDIAHERNIKPINDLSVLRLPEWPADESADDIITFITQQRQFSPSSR